MTRVGDFFADLSRAGKGYLEIKETVEAVYGDKALKKTAIYVIISKVKKGETTEDQRHLNSKKTVRTPALIASVATAIEEDRLICIEALATAHGTSVSIIYAMLHDGFGP
jgi:hypothetical protein